MSGVISYCHIKDSVVYKNGTRIFEQNSDPTNDLGTQLYSWLGIDYAKIHKMDSLSKMGFLASEVLSSDFSKAHAHSTAVVLSNSSSSLDTDLQYWKTMKVAPSPSLFVYTLPNIVAGEICIRNGFKGESIFFVTPSFDVNRIAGYVEMLFAANEIDSCLAGWVEVFNGRVDVFLYLAGSSVSEPFAPHTSSAILDLYLYGKLNAGSEKTDH